MSNTLTDTQRMMLGAAAKRGDRSLAIPANLKGGAARKIAARLVAAGLVKEIKAKAGMPVWRRDEQAAQSYALKLTAAGAKAIVVEKSPASQAASAEVRHPAIPANASTARQSQLDSPAPEAPRRPEGVIKASKARAKGKTETDGIGRSAGVNAEAEGATQRRKARGMGADRHRGAPSIEGAPQEQASRPSPKATPSNASAEGEDTAEPSTAAPRAGSKLALVIAMLQKPEGATLAELASATRWLPHTARAALTGLRKRGFDVKRARKEDVGSSTYRIAASLGRAA